jgi:hypothetical protein
MIRYVRIFHLLYAVSMEELLTILDKVNNGDLTDYTEIVVPATTHRHYRQFFFFYLQILWRNNQQYWTMLISL